jgi:hypothetical protein
MINAGEACGVDGLSVAGAFPNRYPIGSADSRDVTGRTALPQALGDDSVLLGAAELAFRRLLADPLGGAVPKVITSSR